MHGAPAVSYPVGRCAFWRWLLFWQTSGSLALLVAWGCLPPLGLMWCIGAGLMLLAVCANVQATRPGSDVLHWDGQDWHRRSGNGVSDCVGDVKVVLDAQSALLLHWQTTSESDIFQPRASSTWLWLGQERCPAHWLDLRRAVHGPH